MKQHIIQLFLLAATLASACRQPIEIPDVPDGGSGDGPAVVDPARPFGGDVVFSATMAALPDGTQPVWKEGDAIVLSDGEAVQTLTYSGTEGVLASFPARIRENTERVVALTPGIADAVTSLTDCLEKSSPEFAFHVPSEQSAAAPVPVCRLAVSEDSQLYFRIFSPPFPCPSVLRK